ncbi:unnamed protein product, partial [Trichobilharzia regenti]
MDLKNPHFRYNGYPPAPPPGSHVRSPTETYYANLCAQQQIEIQSQAVIAGGVLNSNNSNGQINYRNSPAYTMNQTGGLPATNPISNVVHNIPVAVANDTLVQNQSHPMQLSPQPFTNQTTLDMSRYIMANHSQQVAPAVLRSASIPATTTAMME